MAQGYIPNDMYFQGALGAKQFNLSSGCVNDAAVQSNAGIQATKVVHQYAKEVNQAPGSSVASATSMIHQVFASGTGVATVAGFLVSIDTAGTSPDTVTVDLQKSTGGGAFASILTSVITINSATPAKTPQSASIASPSLNGGDILRVVVTANHSSGTLPQGLISEAFIRENPQ